MVLDFMSMPRGGRIVFAVLRYQITQRGNRREPVFFKDEDRIFYLSLLKDYRKIKGVYVCRGRCRNIEY
jgi:putative transposase